MATKDGNVAAPNNAKRAKKARGRPRVEKKPASLKEAGARSTTMSKRKLRRRKNHSSYKTYIHRVLNQIHPECSVSSQAMKVMNCFIVDFFERIATEAGNVARINKKSTLAAREIQTAVKFLLPNILAKHAATEGTLAVIRFMRRTQ
ncbi:unnamed protein product [Calypogeia fissa]